MAAQGSLELFPDIVLTDEILGIGSFATVFLAKRNDLSSESNQSSELDVAVKITSNSEC